MTTVKPPWEKESPKSRMMSLILASRFLIADWREKGERGDLDFYGAMFALDSALLVKNGEAVDRSIKDVVGRAHEVGCLIMSRWKPLAEDLPINRGTVSLFCMALADVGMYPGGSEDVDEEAVLKARDELYKAQEIMEQRNRKKESKHGQRGEGGDPYAEGHGDGGRGPGREPEAPERQGE